MKALTIWQHWAALIMAQAKPYEFRRYPAPQSLIGQRIVIHAGKRPPKREEILEMLEALCTTGEGYGLYARIAQPLLAHWSDYPQSLMLGVGLGTAKLGPSTRAIDLIRDGEVDGDPLRADPAVWGWQMQAIKPFDAPVPMRGAQGFWNWPEVAR